MKPVGKTGQKLKVKNVDNEDIIMLKHITTILISLLLSIAISAQNTGSESSQIKKQMSEIRKTTDWNNPGEAKKANLQIENLTAKLTQALRKEKQALQQVSGEKSSQPEQDATVELQREMDEYNNKMWNQMMKITREGGTWDLAEPLREEVVAEYKEDENPEVKSKEYLGEMTLLHIDMSLPNIQLIIDQMQHYKSIQTLVITGGETGVPVNLETLLAKASDYPLEQLYIINFKNFVTKIPKAISNFHNLTFLALYNNKISQLPPELGSLTALKKLYVDMNPVVAFLPVINNLNNLDTLGVVKTQITNNEIMRIKKLLPNCKILQ